MNSILAAIPVGCGIAYAWQGTNRFLKAPNRYRLWVWWCSVCLLVGTMVLLYTPIIDRAFPHLLTTSTHLLAHQVYNGCLMLALYCSNLFLDDIMYGPTSVTAKHHHRVVTSLLLAFFLAMALFFVRALQNGESETASWLYAVPVHNPNLMIEALLGIVYMTVLLIRIARFSLRFGRITPLRPFKTANLMFVVICGLTLSINGLALIGIVTPAASLLGHIIVAIVSFVTVISMVVIVFAGRLADHPGKRLRATGAGIWDVVSLVQLHPLWVTLTTALPADVPPDMPKVRPLGWWYIVRHIGAFRDQRIIEILDVVHRLEITLWDDYARSHYWRTNIVQFLDGNVTGATPANQMRLVEEHAHADACRLVVALVDYTPVDLSAEVLLDPAIYAVLSRPPAFSEYEIHYLELVSRAFARVRAQRFQRGQPPVVPGAFAPTLEDVLV